MTSTGAAASTGTVPVFAVVISVSILTGEWTHAASVVADVSACEVFAVVVSVAVSTDRVFAAVISVSISISKVFVVLSKNPMYLVYSVWSHFVYLLFFYAVLKESQ
jgi:hypothetical protein